MDFIGVDLAWTLRGRTGLCHIADGRVVDSTTVSGDEELLSWLTPRTQRDVLVAIDAPLIVRNETGRRPCEQLISRCFGAQHASTHSANLNLPSFKNGVRGEWLADALGLDVDPFFAPGTSVQRAVEVYPHPAVVALFELETTLKYKAKPGRTVESRSHELTLLVRHIESLVSADPMVDVAGPEWERMARIAANPRSAAELAAIEDEIDAYVCAYVALYYWTHGSAKCRVAGDTSTGYILTPVTSEHARCLDALAAQVGAPVIAKASGPGPGDEERVITAFCNWLVEHGWDVEREVAFVDAVASRNGQMLYVEAKGRTSSPGLDVDTLYGQLLRRMPDTTNDAVRFAVVLPETALKAALRVPARVRAMLAIDLFTVSEIGVVREISG